MAMLQIQEKIKPRLTNKSFINLCQAFKSQECMPLKAQNDYIVNF
jgi:hypothetical protein